VNALAVAEVPWIADEAGLVRRYLAWAPQASGCERAEAVSALARAYLHCELKPETRAEAAIALTAALDDADKRVRRALAEALASAREAPRPILLALAADVSAVSRPVLALSPVLTDADLVDAAAVGDDIAQSAIARRPNLSAPVAAALAEIAERRATMALIGNLTADVRPATLWRLFERFGDDADLRVRLIERPGLPAPLRAAIAATTTAELAASLEFGDARRAERIARDSREQAFVAIALDCSERERAELVRWLMLGQHLTVGLLIRSLAGGDLSLFQQGLCEMSGAPLRRIEGLVRDAGGHGFAAVYRKAGLPDHLLPAFRIAARCASEVAERSVGVHAAATLKMIGEIEKLNDEKLAPVTAMLWRLASEGAREDARDFAARALEPPPAPQIVPDDSPAAPPVLLLGLEAGNENAAPPILLDPPENEKAAA
jgi:uncharacterized protein (DUF2336 family)